MIFYPRPLNMEKLKDTGICGSTLGGGKHLSDIIKATKYLVSLPSFWLIAVTF